MKKFKVVMVLFWVGLFFASQVEATPPFLYVVQPGEKTVYEIAKKIATKPKKCDRLMIRTRSDGISFFLKCNSRVNLGETLSVDASQMRFGEVPSSIKAHTQIPPVLEVSTSLAQERRHLKKSYQTPPSKSPEKGFRERKKADWNASFYGGLYSGGKADGTDKKSYSVGIKAGGLPWEYNGLRLGPEARFGYNRSTSQKPGKKEKVYKTKKLEISGRVEEKTDRVTKGANLGGFFKKVNKEGSSDGQDSIGSVVRFDYKDEGRRVDRKPWLPIYKIALKYEQMLHAKTHGNSIKDNQSSIGVSGTLGIKDIYLRKNLRLTPNVNAEIGNSFGNNKGFYVGGGPGANLGDKDVNFLETRVSNFRWYLENSDANTREIVWGKVKVNNVLNALEASGLKKYSGKKSPRKTALQEEKRERDGN